MPAKKKFALCPECGKKYSAKDGVCPHCSGASADAAEARAPKATVAEHAATGSEPFVFEDETDIANWLRGADQKSHGWTADRPSGDTSEKETVASPSGVIDNGERVLEAWLTGKLEDISSWLSGEEPLGPAPDAVSMAEGAVREQLTDGIAEIRVILDELREGLISPETAVERIASALTQLDNLQTENVRLCEELEGVRKGSTALAKYFKSMRGKGDLEDEKIADQLAKEMTAREQLEIENLELRASQATLKDQLNQSLVGIPEDEQELRRLQLDFAEKERILAEKDELLRKREIELVEQESSSRQELRERFAAELQERISEFEKRDAELRSETEGLQRKVKELSLELQHKNEELQMLYERTEGGEISESLKMRLADLQRTERELALRNEEVGKLKDKLLMKDEDLKNLKEPMRYKEDELLRREEELMHREKLLEEEIRRLELAKAELTSQDELELKKRLEMLQAEITAKEEEIISKQKFLAAKEEELRMREQSVIGDEIEKREEERALEFKIEKVKTGTSRLDDLLMGGFPFGANVLIYGPPFTGKEVLANVFLAEGLKKGIPTIWVTTDKTVAEIREEMRFVLSGFEEYEKLGLVMFVDSYSRSMGDDSQEPNVIYVDTPTDFQAIQNAVDQAAKDLLETHKYYRFVFRSISTMIAYLDSATAFRFLNPIVGRRKRDKAVSLYLIEKGMHGEHEIQMVGSLMDGMVEFKVENLNTFLSVKGIGEVQSRAWIRYTSTKSSVNIGSFALDHIR